MRRTIAVIAITTGALLGFAGNANAEGVSAPLTCTDAPEVVIELGGYCGGGVEVSEAVAFVLSDCTDGLPVVIDPATGDIYGDQDRNGRLDGDDCNWS